MTIKANRIGFLIIFLLAFPYLLPNGMAQLGMFSLISKLKYLSIIVVSLMWMGHGNIKVNKLFWDIALFICAITGITFIKDGDFIGCIKMCVDMIFPVMWADLLFKMNFEKAVKYLMYYYSGLAFLNLIIIWIDSDGIVAGTNNVVNLLGEDNKMIFTLLPAATICIYYILKFKMKLHRKRNIIFTLLLFSSALFYIWAATGMAVFLLVLILCLIDIRLDNKRSRILLSGSAILIFATFYGVVYSDFFQQGLVADIITNVLNKAVTFSGRKTLWAQALMKIAEHPLIGYGYGRSSVYMFSFMTSSGQLSGFSCHNGILRILLEGGIVLLFFYLRIFYDVYKVVSEKWYIDKELHILYFSIIGWLIACFFEAEYWNFIFLVMLTMTYHCKDNWGQDVFSDETN